MDKHAGVFNHGDGSSLARATLESPATFRWLGGGDFATTCNFRTDGRSVAQEAAIRGSQRVDSNEILKFSY